jgi:hypothetical protein
MVLDVSKFNISKTKQNVIFLIGENLPYSLKNILKEFKSSRKIPYRGGGNPKMIKIEKFTLSNNKLDK